jgi:hypothetical protein
VGGRTYRSYHDITPRLCRKLYFVFVVLESVNGTPWPVSDSGERKKFVSGWKRVIRRKLVPVRVAFIQNVNLQPCVALTTSPAKRPPRALPLAIINLGIPQFKISTVAKKGCRTYVYAPILVPLSCRK